MLLYYRLYVYFLYELLVICKYLDEYLKKSFIKVNKSFIVIPILLAYKFGGGIYICVDYKGLNNVIVKNYYPIFLIYEIFDVLYYVKFYIKFDIIVAFNRLYIVFKGE